MVFSLPVRLLLRECSPCGCHPLSSSRLISLPKPNGDVRPIDIRESICRLAARTICLQERKSLLKFSVPFSMVCLRNVVQS